MATRTCSPIAWLAQVYVLPVAAQHALEPVDPMEGTPAAEDGSIAAHGAVLAAGLLIVVGVLVLTQAVLHT